MLCAVRPSLFGLDRRERAWVAVRIVLEMIARHFLELGLGSPRRARMPLVRPVAITKARFRPLRMRFALQPNNVSAYRGCVKRLRTTQLANEALQLCYPLPETGGLVDVRVVPKNGHYLRPQEHSGVGSPHGRVINFVYAQTGLDRIDEP